MNDQLNKGIFCITLLFQYASEQCTVLQLSHRGSPKKLVASSHRALNLALNNHTWKLIDFKHGDLGSIYMCIVHQ